MESEDEPSPTDVRVLLTPWEGGPPGSPRLPRHNGPRAGAKSRVCSSLIAAQVGRLAELGAASGRATRPG